MELTIKKIIPFLSLALSLSVSTLQAQENMFDAIPEMLRKGEVSTILAEFSEQPQTLAQIYVNMGRPDKAHDLMERFSSASYCDVEPEFEKVSGKALAEELLADQRILMINENHFNPAARAVALSWLPWLKAQGITHVGFEAFEPDAKQTEAFYIQEPMMSNLFQEATRLGLNVFGYEAETPAPKGAGFVERFEFRDKQQAENIVTRIDDAPADARFLIFAGWGHIAEAPLTGPNLEPYRVMGDFLNNRYGYETLSIDTTACSFEGRNKDPLATYAYRDDDNIINVGSVQNVDIQMRLPMAPADDPSYFRQLLGEPYLPNIDKWPENASVILQAYHTETGFPADRVLSEAGQKLPLYLKSGSYHVTLHDLDGNLLWNKRINLRKK